MKKNKLIKNLLPLSRQKMPVHSVRGLVFNNKKNTKKNVLSSPSLAQVVQCKELFCSSGWAVSKITCAQKCHSKECSRGEGVQGEVSGPWQASREEILHLPHCWDTCSLVAVVYTNWLAKPLFIFGSLKANEEQVLQGMTEWKLHFSRTNFYIN